MNARLTTLTVAGILAITRATALGDRLYEVTVLPIDNSLGRPILNDRGAIISQNGYSLQIHTPIPELGQAGLPQAIPPPGGFTVVQAGDFNNSGNFLGGVALSPQAIVHLPVVCNPPDYVFLQTLEDSRTLGAEAFTGSGLIFGSAETTCPGDGYGTGDRFYVLWSSSGGGTQLTKPESSSPLSLYQPNAGDTYLGKHRDDGWVYWRGYSSPIPGLDSSDRVDGFNDKDQLVGEGRRPDPAAPGSDRAVWWLYLPKPDYGIPSGFHSWESGTFRVQQGEAHRNAINNRGEVPLVESTGAPPPDDTRFWIWRYGQTNATHLIDPTGTLDLDQVSINRVADLNNEGQMVVYAWMEGIYRYLFLSPFGLDVTIMATPERVVDGGEFTLDLFIKNNTDETVTNIHVREESFLYTGDGLAERHGPPDPLGLAPRGTGTLSYAFTATREGPLTVWLDVEGTHSPGATTIATGSMPSPCIDIIGAADLLIKRGDQAEIQYATDNALYPGPVGEQIESSAIRQGETAEFHVRIENDATKTNDFVLRGELSGDAGWTVTAMAGGSNIAAALQSPEGYSTGNLEPGTGDVITVHMTPPVTNGTSEQSLVISSYPDAAAVRNSDAVEAKANLVDVIVVNDDGDESDADPEEGRPGGTDGVPDVDLDADGLQTTLRAAIEFANLREGMDIIEFDIEADGVPEINVADSTLQVNDAVRIDGTTQPAVGQVWIWPVHNDSVVDGLTIATGDSVVQGLVISGFTGYGLVLRDGGGNCIRGNMIGTDPTGMKACRNGAGVPGEAPEFKTDPGGGILIKSSGNTIGGYSSEDRNVISGNFGFGDAWELGNRDDVASREGWGIRIESPASGNLVVGNMIGPNATGTGVPEMDPSWIPWEDLDKHVKLGRLHPARICIADSSHNTIGGLTPAARNIIVAQQDAAVRIEGASAAMNVVQGNYLGTTLDGRRVLGERHLAGAGVEIHGAPKNLIGGDSPGGGNLFGQATYCVYIDGEGAVANTIKGNLVGLQPDAITPLTGSRYGSQWGILVSSGAGKTVIGGASAGSGNTIAHVCCGVEVGGDCNGNTITGNRFHHIVPFAPWYGGVVLDSGASSGNRISRNEMSAIDGLRISLGRDGRDENDNGDWDWGPNGKQNYPVIGSAVTDNGVTILRGSLDTDASLQLSRLFEIEFFKGIIHCKYAASHLLDVGTSGSATFEFTIPDAIAEGTHISATATSPEGNTSEHSRSCLVQGPYHSDPDGISDGIENGVPNRPTGLSLARSLNGTGDGNGDGVADSLQAHVTSCPGLSGQYLTLVASGSGAQLVAVSPISVPSFIEDPWLTFPHGFLEFCVADFSNGTAVVELLLPEGSNVSSFWNYGPTPVNRTPHWYAFSFDGATGAEIVGDTVRLHFVDGLRGDHDLLANGTVTTVGGGADAKALPEFGIISMERVAPDAITLEHESLPDFYYRMRRGQTLDTMDEIVAVTSGQIATGMISDVSATNAPTAYYRMEQLPRHAALDSDGDGMDDAFELSLVPFLDPLDASDAGGDLDGDGRSNVDEYRDGTGLTNADPVVAGTLYVSLDVTDFDSASGVWLNRGTLGNFTPSGDPVTQQVAGVTGVRFTSDRYFVGPQSVADLEGNSDRTIEVWVHDPSIYGMETMVAWGRQGGPSGSNVAFGIGTNETYGAVLHWGSTTHDMGWGDAGPPADGEWHHLAYVYDGATVKVYCDGSLRNERTCQLSTHADHTINLVVQNTQGGLHTNRSGLYIARVRVHGGALTPTRISRNFDIEKGEFGL